MDLDEDIPILVFSDHTTSMFSWLIKWRTKGTYNHVMYYIGGGMFATQNNVYKKVKIEKYQHKKSRLLFFRLKVSQQAKRAILKSIEDKLSLPWWKRRYDWWGIIGQAVGIKKFNARRLEYCSEDVIEHLSACIDLVNDDQEAIITTLPRHEHPDKIKSIAMDNPLLFDMLGTWDYETGYRFFLRRK